MSQTGHNRVTYLQPAFLICAAVLALAGAGMSVAEKQLGLYLKKEPLPLKKPLALMNEAKLAPYQVAGKLSIENEDVLEKLGTEDYIQWVVEDPRAPVDSAVRNVLLFITYYELPDRVPHVPEECYVGSGYPRLARDSVVFETGTPGQIQRVPGTYLSFGASATDVLQGGGQFPVLYLFRVNREYEGGRDDVRLALNRSLFSKHAYFCKIELAYNQGNIAPTKAAAVEASEKLLSVILPLLEQEHWPD
jgi:hypothetical protein